MVKKVISIFGGTGFIGTELVKQLAKNPIEIRIFTRKKTKINYSKYSPRIKVISVEESGTKDRASKQISSAEEFFSELNKAQDSIGAKILINVTGMPSGIGSPVFSKLDGELARALMSCI